jgi:hypothetical protein
MQQKAVSEMAQPFAAFFETAACFAIAK